jgi:hypothetical protein
MTTVDIARVVAEKGIRRTDVSAIYRDWQSGRIGADVVRAALPFAWRRYGSQLEAPEMLAMLRAVGPLSDSPERPMPERFAVYQGRPSGEPLGIAWAPAPELATSYARVWQVIRAARGDNLRPVLRTGTVRAADVLMVFRGSPEVILAPEDVADVHEIAEGTAEDGWEDAWRLPAAEERRVLEREIAGWARYCSRRDYPFLTGPPLEAGIQRVVATFAALMTAS